MARSKKTVEPKNSRFWTPDEGETLSGKFIQWEVLKGGKFNPETPRLGMLVLTKGGEKLVSMSYALTDYFRTIHKKMKNGDAVSITFEKKVKIAGGKTVKEFSASWKGKALERSNAFGKPATKEDVTALFG